MNRFTAKTHLLFLTFFGLALLALTAGVSQADLPGGPPQIAINPFAQGLDFPVAIAHAGDTRLFVAEQEGYIRIVTADGTVLPDPFLDIHERVTFGGEQGLLGLAFHPNYDENGYFYVNYIDSGGDTNISRFQVTADPNVADPASEVIVLEVEQPFDNHNGGDVHFGLDGYLYISLGDGGSGGDPLNNAQRLDNLLGKILRIDVDGSQPYAVPPDNPFAQDGKANTLGEIWVYGLRNPWRFSFDRSTGDMYLGDVGQGTQEEVDFQPADSPGGENYGWSCFEGTLLYNVERCRLLFLPVVQSDSGGPPGESAGATPASGLWPYVAPIFDYPHYDDDNNFLGCVVTGGYVYRGSDYPALVGYYVFGDFCSGRFWLLQRLNENEWQAIPQSQFNISPSAFGENAAGELYVADWNGSLLKVDVVADVRQ
jgi:hypothetical protein